jgi:H/ACA ribonucleoprotein complex subunit 4
LEKATSALAYVVPFGKRYIGLMRLHDEVGEAQLREAAESMEGRIYQRPPKKSAVRRKLRTRTVHRLILLEIVERDVLFDLECDTGFYVRKLVHDLGLVIGVEAHLQELRRVRSGVFTEDESLFDLYRVNAAFHRWFTEGDFSLVKRIVRPYERIFDGMPEVVVRDSAVGSVCHGAQLAVPGVLGVDEGLEEGDTVVLMTQKGEAIAVARAAMGAQEIVNKSRGIAATLERVFMPRDLYPRRW